MATDLGFLQGGGEMGELTRKFDWSKTSLGTPDTWPQSLRITLSILLNSKFPMFIWWGPELIQFYNDAYRPSLGKNGKHPLALGQKGEECWPEIWDSIYPLIDSVYHRGESTWSEDQLLPIYRNGRMEDVYWTFGYSPIKGESNKPEGVLVICTETTAKMNSLRAIEESEQRFSTMAQSTDILIAIADESSNAVFFNKAWVELTGKPMDALLKFGWVDLIHPADKDGYLKLYLDAFEKRVAFVGEFRVLNSAGDYRWLLASNPPRFRADDSFAGYISSCIDITERKHAEQARVKSEEQLRALIESAPFPIGVYTGRNYTIELVNQAMLDVWGKGPDVLGKSYSEVLPELDPIVIKNLDMVLENGKPFLGADQRVDLIVDGKPKTYFFNYGFTPLFDSDGQVYGAMNTGADVTELNMAKFRAQESAKNLTTTILQAPVAMCIFRGAQHVLELANDRMLELWGKNRSEVVGKPIFEGLPEARDQGFEELLNGVYSTGITCSANDVPITLPRDGKLANVFVNFVYDAFHEADGSISGILAIATDVTPQVTARLKIEDVVAERTRELEDSNLKLKQSNAELAQFAYITSHDLQEPLRKITMFAGLLENQIGGDINENEKKYLTKIQSSSKRMTALIRDVLSYSELVKEHVAFEMVDLNQVLRDVEEDYELLIEQKQAVITHDTLPVVQAIPLQMAQLISNLIGNSLKFTRAGEKAVITISCSFLSSEEVRSYAALNPELTYCKITLQDNGIGVEPEYTQQIFNIFQRIHRKSEYEGTGIGLAMCKRITQNHSGDINAEGTKLGSAVFNVLLPVRQNAPIDLS